MTKNIFISILILFVSITCKADTIDYWHVYYNKTKLREFDQFNGGQTLVFKIDSIKTGDSITVKYFRDTPCFDCLTTLTVEDEKHYIVTTNQGKGTFNPIRISIADIIQYKKQSEKDCFEIFYYEEKGQTNKMLLFRIKLE